MFNVASFGATGDGTTDDTQAILKSYSAAQVSNNQGVIYFPEGIYRITKALPFISFAPLSVQGDGSTRSIIKVDPVMAGDVFSWADAFTATNFGQVTAKFPQQAGVSVQGISVVGNRVTSNAQNAFMFYDRADFVRFYDVCVYNMTGRALGSGYTRLTPVAYLRESRFRDFRAFYCGNYGIPTVEFHSNGSIQDASNEVVISSMDIFSPFGPGFVVRNNNPNTGIRAFRIAQLRVEGLQNGVITGDLVQIGDPNTTGNVNNIDFNQAELLDPYSGSAALHFQASSLALQPYQIYFHGTIGGGLPNGKGIVIDAGRDLYFDLRGINTNDTNVKIASTASTGARLYFEGHDLEHAWTWNVDTSALPNVLTPVRTAGIPAS